MKSSQNASRRRVLDPDWPTRRVRRAQRMTGIAPYSTCTRYTAPGASDSRAPGTLVCGDQSLRPEKKCMETLPKHSYTASENLKVLRRTLERVPRAAPARVVFICNGSSWMHSIWSCESCATCDTCDACVRRRCR